MRQQTSAIQRLQSLPSVFRGSDLTIRFQWTSKTASQYLYLWKRRGLVRGLGGHSDVFANLLTNSAPDWGKALRMAMPSAVIVGIEALRQAGWTTQIPQRPAVAVNATHSVFTVEPFDITTRDPKWFDTIRGAKDNDDGVHAPVLRPAWALADLLRRQDWGDLGLWRDDIEWDVVTDHDEMDWQAACAAFELASIPLQSLATASR